MAEQLKPTVNRFLFLSEDDLKLMQGWPLEIRALFDPAADRELAQRIAQEKHQQANRQPQDEEEIPF